MWQPPMMELAATPGLEEENEGDSQAREVAFNRLGAAYIAERNTYIMDRQNSGVERQWREDLMYFLGRDPATQGMQDMMDQVATSGERGAGRSENEASTRSRVVVNITRTKTSSAEARLSDMLFPVDERNWGIKPTPSPEIADMARDTTPVVHQGQPVMIPDKTADGGQRQMVVADEVSKVLTEAKKRAQNMEREIDDQLTECDYNGVNRRGLHDAALYGTGIIKGPVIRNRKRRSWRKVEADGKAIHVLDQVQRLRPVTEFVSVWDFFPDMSCANDIQNAEAIWQRSYISKRRLRELASDPDYMAGAIRACLQEGPRRAHIDNNQHDRSGEMGWTPPDDRQFEVWERHGDIEAEYLRMCGCEDIDEQIDPLQRISGCLVIINDRVIKAYLNPLETGDLPYDVFVWEEAPNRPFGYGIPYQLRQASQRILTAAVRQIMDNGGLSSGPQVVVNEEAVKPADGKWVIHGRKLWKSTGDIDVEKAFQIFQVQSNVGEMMAVVEMARKFADEEIAFPMIMAGERGDAPEQVGSMQMLMNAATVVLRRLVKRFDDYVTKPHIRRYYDWNMQFNPKEEIKGDYEVDARGSTALLQRDLQNQAIQKWLAALGNEAIAWYFEGEKLVKKALQADYITPDDVMATDDEIARRREQRAKMKPGPTPDAELRAQASIKTAELREQGALARTQMEIQADAENANADREHDLMLSAVKAEDAQRDREHDRTVKTDSMKAGLATNVMRIRADKEASAAGATTVAVT